MNTTSATSSASYRDPENAAFSHDDTWYRIAAPASARALDTLRTSPLYDELVGAGHLIAFDEADPDTTRTVLSAYRASAGREPDAGARVYRVASVKTITYPWEWPNALLQSAALHTLRMRDALLGIGLDLKDAAAANVQFRGARPVFVDLGSVEEWRPNPSWNASRQFIEQFVNPLAVGAGEHLSSADAWNLGQRRGLRSEVARTAMDGKRRRAVGLWLLQASTRPVESNKPAETKYAKQAGANPELARKATTSLTARLRKQVLALGGDPHATTWAGYGSREHYAGDDLGRKDELVRAFVAADPSRARLVLDVGGNDGHTATHLARTAAARVIVMDADAGALDNLTRALATDGALASGITPLIGDLTNLTPDSGLLSREWSAFVSRVRPSAVTCQAVLHHIVITQGVPMPLAVDALAAFGAPLQIELALPDDPKVQLLIGQIPNWAGDYSLDALVAALRERYAHVEEAGRTSATRVVVNAW